MWTHSLSGSRTSGFPLVVSFLLSRFLSSLDRSQRTSISLFFLLLVLNVKSIPSSLYARTSLLFRHFFVHVRVIHVMVTFFHHFVPYILFSACYFSYFSSSSSLILFLCSVYFATNQRYANSHYSSTELAYLSTRISFLFHEATLCDRCYSDVMSCMLIPMHPNAKKEDLRKKEKMPNKSMREVEKREISRSR